MDLILLFYDFITCTHASGFVVVYIWFDLLFKKDTIIKIFKSITLLVFFINGGVLGATNYYVSTSGDNSNSVIIKVVR